MTTYTYGVEKIDRHNLSKTRYNFLFHHLEGTIVLDQEPRIGEAVYIYGLSTSLKISNIVHRENAQPTLILDGSTLR